MHADRTHADCLIIGGGHNGLVAAAVLARRGKRVVVLEAADVIGGACRTERPFARAPGLACSTGAYLLGPMPPEVLQATGIQLEILPRRPHGFFIANNGRPVAFGAGPRGLAHLDAGDRAALDHMDAALAAIRDAVGPLWLRPDATLAGARAALPAHARAAFDALAAGTPSAFLDLFALRDPVLRAVVATDAFVGSDAGFDSPGAGLNFLAHNLLRLPAGDGSSGHAPLGAWQLVRGGMGAVTAALAHAAQQHGGEVRTRARVVDLRREAGLWHATLADAARVSAHAVILATDPVRAGALLPGEAGEAWRARVGTRRSPGTSLKVNIALSALPEVVGSRDLLGDPFLALRGTVHPMPRGDGPDATRKALERARAAARAGRVPNPADVMIDVYTHTAVDDSLRDDAGRHAMSFFVQWVPSDMSRAQAADFAHALIQGPVAAIMPDLPRLVEEVMVLPPREIEQRFGITGGHIHHLDNRHAFEHRLGVDTGVQGVFYAGAGAHPAGSVIGAAGYIAAHALDREAHAPV